MQKILLVALLFAVVFATTARADDDWEEPEPPTDAEVKKMKVKELKAWLANRGLPCTDCFEKGDYVKTVKKNRGAKLLASKRPRKISKEPIEKQWKKVVEEMVEEEKVDAAVAKPFMKVIEGSFEQHVRKVSKQLHTEKHVIARTSLSEPYVLAMTKKVRSWLRWAKKEGVKKQDAIREKVDNDIKMFLTAVAVKNVNPMHEILDAKDEL
eukprot:TRINITY_DN58218_c0_g1_i1.p1 TRINITY_DN58218_c0_g1~~TRINITY_DN58218_c0_g1_i1.p1  ORF type:complete len:210 (+),score=107.47 TRINITY_DN58218_c0_g1_i1:70-699(+)